MAKYQLFGPGEREQQELKHILSSTVRATKI
jgi:hypothetical protein